MGTIETLKREREMLMERLPEPVPIETLSIVSDYMVLKGLKRLETIIDDRNASNEEIIKANNSIVATGKLIEYKRNNEKERNQVVVIDNQDLVLG